jgi:hypothetical protein
MNEPCSETKYKKKQTFFLKKPNSLTAITAIKVPKIAPPRTSVG